MTSFGLFPVKLTNSTCCKLFYFTGQLGQEVLKDEGPQRYLLASGQRPFQKLPGGCRDDYNRNIYISLRMAYITYSNYIFHTISENLPRHVYHSLA